MNEILLVATGFLSTFFVYVAWKLGEERLYTAIVAFLILIATVGGKLVEFFGHETNTGNIFYAAVFLATYFLIERFGKAKGLRSIWIATIVVVFYTILAQLSVLYVGTSGTGSFSAAVSVVFASSLRVTFASVVAFVASQTFNVYLYTYLRERFKNKYLWLRANTANALAQILDSGIFFLVAFGGVVAPENISDIIATGILIKIAYMALASPLLYLNVEEREENHEDAAITLRWQR